MKIGILTFHSQLNYGGVLQAYALQETLRGLGHEVFVIDRWLDDGNATLENGFDKMGVRDWCRVFIESLLGGWNYGKYKRVKKTKHFISDYLCLTPYHFNKWRDAPIEIGFDVIIVGSDQVWHGDDESYPSVYLLEGAPKLPAIAYAASFGMSRIPEDMLPLYTQGVGRFKAISCRELEGVAHCAGLGATATHVMDPVLLAGDGLWDKFDCKCRVKPYNILCYLIGNELPRYLKAMEMQTLVNNVTFELFVDGRFGVGFPRSLSVIAERFSRKTKIRVDAGPLDFVLALKNANFIITDSFHALMFAAVFNKNVRVLRPQDDTRKKMFARISEFCARYVEGPVVVAGIDEAVEACLSGLKVTYRSDELNMWRETSRSWLKNAIASCERC